MPEERSTLSAKLSRFPRLGLAHLPTPLEPMKRLTEHLGGPRLWVKREDATGVGFGGNKLRELGADSPNSQFRSPKGNLLREVARVLSARDIAGNDARVFSHADEQG